MNIHAPKLMTAEDFAHWSMRQETGRYELIDGVVVRMNAEQVVHGRVKLRIAKALEEALKRSGLQGEVFGDGMAVKIAERVVHEPDSLVRLGALLPDDTVLVTDPVIVVEAPSPSTGPVDTGTKLVNYFKLPAVAHYLVVNTTKRIVLHYFRGADGKPAMNVVEGGHLTLDPPGLSLLVVDFFS